MKYKKLRAKDDSSFDEEIWINTVPIFYENQKEDLLLTDERGIQWVALSKYADTGKGDLAYNKLLIWNWLYGYFVTDEQLVTLKKYADKKVNLINSDISWIPEAYTIHNESLVIKKYTDWTGLLEYKGDFVEGDYYITEYR